NYQPRAHGRETRRDILVPRTGSAPIGRRSLSRSTPGSGSARMLRSGRFNRRTHRRPLGPVRVKNGLERSIKRLWGGQSCPHSAFSRLGPAGHWVRSLKGLPAAKKYASMMADAHRVGNRRAFRILRAPRVNDLLLLCWLKWSPVRLLFGFLPFHSFLRRQRKLLVAAPRVAVTTIGLCLTVSDSIL